MDANQQRREQIARENEKLKLERRRLAEERAKAAQSRREFDEGTKAMEALRRSWKRRNRTVYGED